MSKQWSRKNKAKDASPSPSPSQTGMPGPDDHDLLWPAAIDKTERSIFYKIKHKLKGSPSSSRSVTPEPQHTSRATELPQGFSAGLTQVVTSVPGEWELDQEFLAALTNWEHDHPQSTLGKILQNISEAIEIGKPFLDIRPDDPLPAQSLVKGLCHVLQLGTSLSNANFKLRAFILDVVQWITGLKSSIASFQDKKFAHVEWKNLAKVRFVSYTILVHMVNISCSEVIDKICKWAQAQLV
ncbi:hypothetical protein H0H87_012500 [Tephrocybe sp. NHM501043]|nr:hypothetical protein H0H87_012500 [Tephrocybe sp. NHM501043]